MLLVPKAIEGRAFLLQFQQIMSQFGSCIPWLQGANAFHFVTNGQYFKERLHRTIGCTEGTIVPYQLVSADRSREYVGSILHFAASPEKFQDPKLQRLQTSLVSSGATYISCLLVRDVKRGIGYGTDIMLRATKSILEQWPKVWAVCEPELVPWYVSLGAIVYDHGDNADHLALISWER